jgi:hypothetical protein
MMKKVILLLVLASLAGGAAAAGADAQPAVEGHGCRNVNGMARAKDGTMLTCVDPESVWKLASDPTAKSLCQKNGKTTNPDGTTVQCRIENGKVVPIN